MIKDIKCDIFKCNAEIILQQANCQNTMASGIAKVLRDKWSKVYDVDCLAKAGNYNKLGQISIAKIDDPVFKYVINCYSQEFYGHDQRYTNYEALFSALEKVEKFCRKNQIKIVAAPYKMAANLSGGDWRIVRPIFEVVFEKSPFDVLICNNEDL